MAVGEAVRGGRDLTARYAIYYAPAPEAPLWRLGSAVIGHDAASGSAVAPPDAPPFSDPDWHSLTQEPRRYGFHATLKAPFALRDGASEADLLTAARRFARGRQMIELSLTVAAVAAFTALVPSTPEPRLDELAAACVEAFEPFRQPLTVPERARRLASPLTERQLGHLDRWGYPFVFDEFRFHMTLTGPLPPERREPIRAAVAERFARIPLDIRIDAVAIFRQDGADKRFRLLERMPFGG